MRKTAIFILAITLCALLSGCGKAMTVSLPFAASDVENVEMYHYVVPASAEKKIITQADAISELYAVFSELPVSDRKTEPVVGGAVTSFRFNLSDHTSYEIIYCAEAVKKGRLKLPAEQQDYFTCFCFFASHNVKSAQRIKRFRIGKCIFYAGNQNDLF